MMKKIILLFSLCFAFIATTVAQNFPSGINYQAVARNHDGQVIPNKAIGIKISMFTSADRANPVFSESHQISTNELGLFDLVVGQGSALTSTFNDIPWSSEEIWIDIALDDEGGTNYKSISTSKLFAVPYAIHALTASKLSNETIDKGNEKMFPPVPVSGCSGPLVLTQFETEYMTVACDGDINIPQQVTITKNLGSSQDSYNNYALRVEGRHQGMAVKLTDRNNPTRNNNWMTFFAADGSAKGRIEGFNGLTGLFRTGIRNMIDRSAPENRDEEQDPGPPPPSAAQYFNNDYAVGALSETLDLVNGIIKVTTNAIACAVGIGIAGDCDDIFWSIIDAVVQGVQLGGYIAYNELNLGATFESGGADYAEWLQKADMEEQFLFGEVVGIVGGQISKSFADADKFMVISGNPGIIGAMPEGGKEDHYEVVAFMGQVPVKVLGAVKKGDYILPSGNGDGIAIAVSRDEMKARDFQRIVGIAWSDSEPDQLMNYINTAVGINSNDLGAMVEQLQFVVNELQQAMEEVNPEFEGRFFDVGENVQFKGGEYSRSLTMEQIARQNFDSQGTQTQKEASQFIKEFASSQKLDLKDYPYLLDMVENPNDIELMKKAQTHYTAVLQDILTIYKEGKSGD